MVEGFILFNVVYMFVFFNDNELCLLMGLCKMFGSIEENMVLIIYYNQVKVVEFLVEKLL